MTQRQELEQLLTINTHKIVLKEEELMIAMEEKLELERNHKELILQNRNLQVCIMLSMCSCMLHVCYGKYILYIYSWIYNIYKMIIK